MATVTASPIIVPAELDFGDDAFIVSEELAEIGGDLIELHPGILGDLADRRAVRQDRRPRR